MPRVKYRDAVSCLLLALVMIFPLALSAENTAGQSGDFFAYVIDELSLLAGELQLLKVFAIIFGLFLVALIVLRISWLLNKPKPDIERLMKEKEEAEFKGMLSEKDKVLEDLKQKLSPERKRNHK